MIITGHDDMTGEHFTLKTEHKFGIKGICKALQDKDMEYPKIK